MKDQNEIIDIISRNKKEIKSLGVKNLQLFGSYANKTQTIESDIDILVEFNKGKKNFDNFMNLKFYLQEILNTKVDLVTKKALRPEIEAHINGPIIYAEVL